MSKVELRNPKWLADNVSSIVNRVKSGESLSYEHSAILEAVAGVLLEQAEDLQRYRDRLVR